MIWKFKYGDPIETEAVVEQVEQTEGVPTFGEVNLKDGFCYRYTLSPDDVVYGLGEAVRGINKRGHRYISNASDDPNHLESTKSLYGAHNFLVIAGEKTFGLFVDYPAKLTFDIGYTKADTLEIRCENADLYFYVIDGDTPYGIARQFRKIIGRSYIPPKFAFGFGQSRWGYRTKEDFRQAVRGYRENHIPIDMLYMDIDYMQDYKDFTWNEEEFPDFSGFVREMKEQRIHLVPIIDAGVKVEPGYPVYEEGVQNGYFCKRADGCEFTAAVWPGYTHFPDVLNPEARCWFGGWYRVLIEQGIDGFWNDMNEPAIFYTPEGLNAALEVVQKCAKDEMGLMPFFQVRGAMAQLSNAPQDYERFYHQINGRPVRHDKVHNLFGYNMTRAAAEGFEQIDPDRRFLLFSRSSYIGMHRYGGIWMGDNKSWWDHLLLNLKMLPSLNMCGFLYIGADLGGFGDDATRDLLLRWLALGVFTPLMRNHSALGTRMQECWRFEDVEDFRHVIGVRYRLLPYLYSEYMKAALSDDLYFKPLAFVYPQDAFAAQVEDQLMLGGEIMIAPVYTQNAKGRYVYLPEEMLFVKFLPDGSIYEEKLHAGHHYVKIALDEVPLFIRAGKCIPLAQAAESVEELRTDALELLGWPGAEYLFYDDDGVHKAYSDLDSLKRMEKLS